MLLNFKLKNFKSYLNESVFSMVANCDKSHIENLVPFGKDYLSKARIMYGANASGKTSFIEAIDFVKTFAIMSNRLVEGNRIAVNPYRFRDNFADSESEFSIEFEKNEIKYFYSFSCSREKVINEKLDIYNSAKATNIFTRTDTDNYKFNSDVKILNEIKSKNTKNKLFLITAATWNYEKVKPVVNFLINDIVVISVNEFDHFNDYYLDYMFEHNDFEDYKNFCLELVNDVDIQISDFEVNTKKIEGKTAEILLNMAKVVSNDNSAEIDKFINNKALYNIKTHHKITNEKKEKDYILDLARESNGTQRLFNLAPVLYYVFKEGKILLIDEIDRTLHPILVRHLIKKFSDKELNKKNAQLICNTHDSSLMDLDLFRRDDIWFSEKDNKTGISSLYSLADFSPRLNENIEKAYMLGRFGAVPFIKEF